LGGIGEIADYAIVTGQQGKNRKKKKDTGCSDDGELSPDPHSAIAIGALHVINLGALDVSVGRVPS
jgi:hypothetical protein